MSKLGQSGSAGDRPGGLILHISTTIARGGGAEKHLVDLVDGQRNTHEVAVAYLKDENTYQPELENLGVPVYYLRSNYGVEPCAIGRLRRLLRTLRPSIIHVHGSPAELLTYLACVRMHHPPVVITRHEERRRLFRLSLFPFLDRELTRTTERFIAVSDSVRRIDIERSPEIADKMRVVHHGLATTIAPGAQRVAATKLRREWGVPEDALILGTLARMVEEKALDTMIAGYAAFLNREVIHDVRLALVGRGPLEPELREIARAHGVEDRIIWAGFRKDVEVVLEAFDIFVLTSTQEGFGIVLLEAMAAGLPIIATRTGALPEIVDENRTGLLFPPRDTDALASVIGTLVANPSMRQRMGEAGRERLQTVFTIERMVAQTKAVYESLADDV